MKRLLLLSTLTLLLVILLGGSAFATYARIRSLGNADYYFKDISHIYLNPAFLGQYTNSVYSELGQYYDGMGPYDTPYDQTLGINYKIYKGLSLGLTLNRYVSWDADVFPQFQYIDEYMDFPEPINGYDLMASYDFEKLHLGVGFYHAGNKATANEDYSYTDTITGDRYYYYDSWNGEATSGITSLTGGFLFDVDENKWIEGMVSLSFDRAKYHYSEIDTYYYQYYDASYKDTWDDTYKTDGGNRLEFGGRAFWEVVENFQVVPLFIFGTESLKLDSTISYAYQDNSPYDTAWTYTGKTGKIKWDYMVFGLGGNLKLDKGMVAGGLSLYHDKWTDETQLHYKTEYTETTLPGFNLGVEYELTKWLTARVGMEKWFGRYEYKDNYDDWEPPWHYTDHYKYTGRFYNDPEDFIGLGVGFKFSKFKVDATVGEQSLFQGGYILSGQQKNMFGILSATFEF
jgi:hypothetical protein